MPPTLPAPNPSTGALFPPALAAQLLALFNQGLSVIQLPVGFGLADAAPIFTVPAGTRVRVASCFWEVTTPFTGGTSSAVGLSSSNAAYSTKGDLLGGAAGDPAANLVAGIHGGTLGTKYASNGVIVLNAGDQILFNRIASAFTAGAGLVHVECVLLPTS